MVARISGDLHSFDIAEHAAGAVLASPSVPYLAAGPLVGLALMAVQKGDATGAQEQYKALVSRPLSPRYGLALALETMDYEAAREVFGRAQAFAQEHGDKGLEMKALAAAADADWYYLQLGESVKKGRRAIELAGRTDNLSADDLPTLVMAHVHLARALDFIGDLEGARQHMAVTLSMAEKLGDRSWLAWALWVNGTLYRLEGNWEAARGFLDRGLEMAPREPTLLCTRGVLEYETGNTSLGRTYMDRLVDVMRQTAPGPVHEYA